MLVKLVKNVGCSVQGHFSNCQRFLFLVIILRTAELYQTFCAGAQLTVTVEFESSWNVPVFCIF